MKLTLPECVIKLKSIKFKMATQTVKSINQLEKSEKIQALMDGKGIRMGYPVGESCYYIYSKRKDSS